MIEIIGIAQSLVDTPGNRYRWSRKIFVREVPGNNYSCLEYPMDGIFNKKQVTRFIGEKLGCEPKDIFWLRHIRI